MRLRRKSRPVAARSSNTLSPRSSVSRNRSSSAFTTDSISVRVLDDLGIPLADLPDDDRRQAVDALEPDPPGLHDGSPDQPTEDVATALVRRRHPFGNQEGHPATVVAEHAVSLRRCRG